ncbi:MAG: hypothetical protein RI957_790 [Verrucomicrobiota bacterium]
MKQQNLIFAVAGVALLVGGMYLGSNMGKKNSADADAAAVAAVAAAMKTNATNVGAAPAAGAKASSNDRSSDGAWAKLAEKYGDGRTKLSKKISQDMAGLMKDAMQLADMGAGLAGASSAKELAIKQASDALASRLGLNDEQKTKASAIVEQRVGERMDAVNELAAALESDPSGMMETILAGDALKRGEITQQEYDTIANDTLAVMRNVSGFAFSGRGGNDLSDPILADQLQSILTPDQQEKLAGIVQKASEAQAKNPQQMPFQNGNLPAMELEKLDQTMASAQKLTTGLKAMMEGLQGMKDLAPPQNGQ